MPMFKSKTIPRKVVPLRVPVELLERIDQLLESDGNQVSRNEAIIQLIKKGLERVAPVPPQNARHR